jgi:ABC-type transport system involved in multi-copper enzyme maturation permease subunit
MANVMKYGKTIRSFVVGLDAPVLVHEMRVRLRGWRPFVLMLLSVIALSALTLAMLRGRSLVPSEITEQVRRTFLALISAQLALVVVTTPALSASSVSGEREKGTLELLALTTLPSSAITGQKFAAVVLQSALLTLVSVPVVAVVFLIGGISPAELVIAYALVFFSGALMAALGLFCSCTWKSSRVSTAIAYTATVVYLIGAPLSVAWLRNVSSVGVTDYAAASPYLFIAMFAFTGGLFALMVYSVLAAILHRRASWWRTRVNRMVVFGAAYAFLLLILSLDTGPAVQYVLNFNVFDVTNPFIALVYMMNSQRYAGYPGIFGWAWITTIIFTAAVGYFLLHVSSLRFSALRRG